MSVCFVRTVVDEWECSCSFSSSKGIHNQSSWSNSISSNIKGIRLNFPSRFSASFSSYRSQGSFYCCQASAFTRGWSSRNDLPFFRNGVSQLVYRPSRSSSELISIFNPASLLAGKALLYEAENDRSKTEKIESDVLSIGCDIEWDLSREQRLRLSFVFEEVKRSLERRYEAVEDWVRASGCEYWIPCARYPCFF